MLYIVFEDSSHFDLRPFTYTRPIWALRSGIFTFRERWEKVLGKEILASAYDYLSPKFGSETPAGEAVWINGKLAPDAGLLDMLSEIAPNSYICQGEEILLARFEGRRLPENFAGLLSLEILESLSLKKESTEWSGIAIRQMPDLFQHNASLIHSDFDLITRDRVSQKIQDKYTRIYGADNLFVEEGVNMRAATINAEDGPVYLGKGVELMEGSVIRGTHAFGTGAKVYMGAKLRGDSSFGPHSKVGGEVTNSVIMGFSNKSHEGYLGNSVLGYWCNLGADTNTSNLKNNYSEVKLWNYTQERFRKTGSIFCGLMMADHSKCGINTMFNSGTVVGVSANIFGGGYPRNFLPSFSWGGVGKIATYSFAKASEVARVVMDRRGLRYDEEEIAIMKKVFDLSASYRSWDR